MLILDSFRIDKGDGRSRGRWVFLAAIWTALACPDCGKSCTSQGCIDGARILLNKPLSTGGSYTFQLTSESGDVRCTTQGQKAGDCDGTRGIIVDIDALEVTGFVLEDRHPENITIKVLRGGQTIRSGAVTLQYQALLPNGEDCPGQCDYAEGNL